MSESEVTAAPARFPVVGLGASAGGLEALSSFLASMPSPSGIAFVAVTHQHAGHVSQLPEILARRTKLDVVAAVEGARVEVDHLYVCPPGARLALLDGVLHLFDAEGASGNLPIDAFFRSLATDMKERAVAVVLSGTGSDGTVGARLVKAGGGLVLAQAPSSAEHDGMPASVIRSGAVDDVMRAEDMAVRLLAHAGLLAQSASHGPVTSRIPDDLLQRLLMLVRERTGHDLSSYKQSTVIRRTERRMNVRQIDDPAVYVRYAQDHPEELDLLFKDVLISVTTFFRDPEVWQRLQDDALGALLRSLPEGETFRAWVPGCATGEEAYTIAIAVREVCERDGIDVPLQVFATDLDGTAVDTARSGLFSASISADVGPERLARWFRPERGGYRIRQEIRERVAFAPHDLLQDPPFTRIHLLSCRNVLIYLQPRLQQRLMPLFHYALRSSGILLLGNSETVGQVSELFEAVDQRARIFRRRDGSPAARGFAELRLNVARRSDLTVGQPPADAADGVDLATLVARDLAARYVPPSIVVDSNGEVIHVQGRTGPFLELATGRPSCNAFLMARPGLQLVLTSAVREALARGGRVAHRGVEVRGDEIRHVDVVAEPLETAHARSGLVLISFEPSRPATAGAESDADELRISELEREVARTGDHLRRTNEELQRSNEELQSSNEELQSSNEELETSKEEMQSLNEELHTVNAELQVKVDALSRVNDDMANLLESTAIATVFLDRSLRIKRYTQPLTELIRVIDTDVGRPIADLASALDYDQLPQDAETVLRTLVLKEKQLRARNGRYYLMRILPYRTTENVIDGVVVTFIDTTELHAARLLAESRRLALSIVDTVREPLVVLDDELRVMVANRAFYRTFQLDPGGVAGRALHEIGAGEWNIPVLRHRLAEIVSSDAAFEDLEVVAAFARIGRKRLLLNARRLRQEPEQAELVLLAMDAVDAAEP